MAQTFAGIIAVQSVGSFHIERTLLDASKQFVFVPFANWQVRQEIADDFPTVRRCFDEIIHSRHSS